MFRRAASQTQKYWRAIRSGWKRSVIQHPVNDQNIVWLPEWMRTILRISIVMLAIVYSSTDADKERNEYPNSINYENGCFWGGLSVQSNYTESVNPNCLRNQ
jgi:hypothetical protein